MYLEWSDKYSVGVPAIDKQHQELFKQVNSLMEAMKAGRGREEIETIVSFLEKYVVIHFGDEERLMTRYGYPDLATHKAEHAAFVRQFGAIKRDIAAGKITTGMLISLQSSVVGWLKNHVVKVDRKYGDFIQKG